MKLWSRWVERCDTMVDVRPLVAVRILLAACVAFDLLRVQQLGLTPVLFKLGGHGGLTAFHDPHLVIHAWWGASAGPIAMGVTLVSMGMVMVGVWTRPAILIGVLAYSQLGHLFPPGDRAVDRIIRTALLMLMFTRATGPWWRIEGRQTRGWSVDMLKFFLVMIYLSAGLAKLIQQPGWLSLTAEPPLLRIMTDPMSAHLDPTFWAQYPWLFRLGSWGTIVLELSSVLIFTRWCRHWAVIGAAMHVGIFLTMGLGMFSLGMLSFYPVLFAAELSRPRAAPAG
jgi:hypothetical protein